MTRPRIGLALGSGSARGWSHIGVIDALAEAGLEPERLVLKVVQRPALKALDTIFEPLQAMINTMGPSPLR